MITVEDYKAAEQLLKDYKFCGNIAFGCRKVFKTENVTQTIQYAQVYYWCKDCYKKIADDY